MALAAQIRAGSALGVTRSRRIRPRQGRKGFQPFVAPVMPPPGTYDPTLDSSVRAADRGYGYYQSDYARDYGAPGAIGGRTEYDYLLNRGQLQQGHDRSLSDLLRGYSNLATSQTEAGNAAGLLGGGFAAQAAAKRAANQGRDQTRLEQDFGQRFGALDLAHTRGREDASTAFTRAGVENQQFHTDTAKAAWYQAGGMGIEPPQRPGNEFTMKGPHGSQVYRDIGNGMVLLPNGQRISKAALTFRLHPKRAGIFSPGLSTYGRR